MTGDHPMHGTPPPAHPTYGHWPFRRSAAKRYGVAALAVIMAFAMRYAIYGDLENRIVFTFFVPAALVAAWYGGLGPGILATVLGLLLGNYFFLAPRHAFWSLQYREILAVVVYTATTVLCVVLCENLHRYIRRLEHALDHARHDQYPEPHSATHPTPSDAAATR